MNHYRHAVILDRDSKHFQGAPLFLDEGVICMMYNTSFWVTSWIGGSYFIFSVARFGVFLFSSYCVQVVLGSYFTIFSSLKLSFWVLWGETNQGTTD